MLIEKTVCYMRIFRWVNVTWSYLLFCCFPVDRIFFFSDNLHHSRCHSSVTECMTFVICDQQVFIGCRNALFFFFFGRLGLGELGGRNSPQWKVECLIINVLVQILPVAHILVQHPLSLGSANRGCRVGVSTNRGTPFFQLRKKKYILTLKKNTW